MVQHNIHDDLIDVDFRKQPYRRGLQTRSVTDVAEHQSFASFADSGAPVIPRSEWPDLIQDNTSLEELVMKIKDQGQEGSCASNAAAQCFEICWNLMNGTDNWVEMSPISLYRWLSRGPGSGSTITGNLRQSRDVGLLPVDRASNRQKLESMNLDPNHVLKSVGYYQKFPAAWKDTAGNFVTVEFFEVNSWVELISALFADMPVLYGRAGHAICGVTPVLREGSVYIKYANSWKPSWGDNGYGYDSERAVSRSVGSYGAVAWRTVALPDGLIDTPPPPNWST